MYGCNFSCDPETQKSAWQRGASMYVKSDSSHHNDAKRAPSAFLFLGFLLIVPAVVYLVLLTLWHWKSRYRGRHSNLWGGLLVIETSGWSKLVYLFRHIIPDYRGTGRYARNEPEAKAQREG
jgi:hypothetical protein